MNKRDSKKAIKWVKQRMGEPLIVYSVNDEFFEIMLEIVEEDLKYFLEEIKNPNLPTFVRNTIITRLLLSEVKRSIGRVKTMYKSTWTLDYQTLLEDGHKERKVIFELIKNLDIYK